MNDILRVPPHSIAAEQSLIGGVLLMNEAFEQVSWLPESALYADQHRRLWVAISKMIESSKQVDMVTLCDALGADELEKVGGAPYIAGLMQNTASAVNLRRYADLIYEKFLQRQLAQVATEIAEAALAPVVADMGRLLDESESRILRIAESRERNTQGPVAIGPLLTRVYERIDHLHMQDNASGVTGVPSGFVDLDQKTAGFQPGDLIIVAGRPSMGKTAFALNVAEHVAVKHGLPVVVFSMEMSGTQLASRLLGSLARVDQHRMRTGRLADDEWARLSDGVGQLHDRPIDIDDSGGLTALELRARARRLKRKNGKLGLIVIDYMQMMEAKAPGENRATEVAEISRSLKAMAKELDCPVMALSQLTRKVDERHDRRPIMSDLRESGAIEQDADVILFIYREEVYRQDLPDEERGRAEVIIGKQRNGPIGTIPLTYINQHTRFQNYLGTDNYYPRPRQGKVRNFSDFKSAAAGDS